MEIGTGATVLLKRTHCGGELDARSALGRQEAVTGCNSSEDVRIPTVIHPTWTIIRLARKILECVDAAISDRNHTTCSTAYTKCKH